jgi:hypothetical protein
MNREIAEQVVELAAQLREYGGGDLELGQASVHVAHDEEALTLQLSSEGINSVPGV